MESNYQHGLRPSNPLEEKRQYQGLVQIGLRPEITSYVDYYNACLVGIHRVLVRLEGIDLVRDFSAELLSNIHRCIFEEVHPWAGCFRTEAERVMVGDFYGVSGELIELELELAKSQFHEILTISFYDEDHSRDIRAEVATAFLHARLNRIHPFLDGNGRCGRIVLANQFYGLTKRELIVEDRMVYLGAMRAANSGNLTHLVNLILTGSEQEYVSCNIDLPFNISSDIEKGEFRLEVLLERSRNIR